MPASNSPTVQKAPDVLAREFLGMRARLLDVAATLDRIDRADGSVADDERLDKIRQATSILAGAGPGRAEKLQMLFSLPFEDD